MENSSHTKAPARSGLSLLEILISVFVLSIGLLGVAAVIPLGHHQMVEATKSDRAAACGQAGLHEVRTRGWLDPTRWRRLNTGSAPNTILVTDIDGNGVDDGAIRMRDSFAIDPLFFAHPDNDPTGPTDRRVSRFPLDASDGGEPMWMRESSLVRVTFNQIDYSIPVYRMPFAAASRIFTWRDDMLFPVPDDPDDRPRQLVMWDGGQGFAYPFRSLDAPAASPAPTSPVIPQADDNYSWMATVTPILDGPGNDFATMGAYYAYVNKITRYTVSIVVFYKRNFECPADLNDTEYPPQERSVGAYFPGDGYGGGDVLLVAGNNRQHWLDVKKNGWLMIRGTEQVSVSAGLAPRTVAKWYRVVAVDDDVLVGGVAGVPAQVPGGSFGRYVTLSGPDWRVDTDGDGTFEPMDDDWAVATLVDDVIGVYTTTVEADYGSVWTQ